MELKGITLFQHKKLKHDDVIQVSCKLAYIYSNKLIHINHFFPHISDVALLASIPREI
jgi:hypothetical protein